eukprot:gene2585-3338_t
MTDAVGATAWCRSLAFGFVLLLSVLAGITQGGEVTELALPHLRRLSQDWSTHHSEALERFMRRAEEVAVSHARGELKSRSAIEKGYKKRVARNETGTPPAVAPIGKLNESGYTLRCDLATLPCGCYLDCLTTFGRMPDSMPPYCFKTDTTSVLRQGAESIFNAPILRVDNGELVPDPIVSNCRLSPNKKKNQTCVRAPWAQGIVFSETCGSAECVPTLQRWHSRLKVSSYIRNTHEEEYAAPNSKEAALRAHVGGTCNNPTCGGNGICVHGGCECGQGFRAEAGSSCIRPEGVASLPARCLSGCGEHGTCKEGTCICHTGFYGSDCSLSFTLNRTELLWGKMPRAEIPSPVTHAQTRCGQI